MTTGATLTSHKGSKLRVWKHFTMAEFCSDNHKPFPSKTMHDTYLLLSLLTVKFVSVVKVSVLKTLIVLPQPHHSFPILGSILDTGIQVVPTATVVGKLIFHPLAKRKNNM